MKKLKTISEREILRIALDSILDRYFKELARKEAGSIISEGILVQLNEQIKEIEARIVHLESVVKP